MSREEAASIYLDVLLGFRNEYGRYLKADEALTDQDKDLLQSAVFEHSGRTSG